VPDSPAVPEAPEALLRAKLVSRLELAEHCLRDGVEVPVEVVLDVETLVEHCALDWRDDADAALLDRAHTVAMEAAE